MLVRCMHMQKRSRESCPRKRLTSISLLTLQFLFVGCGCTSTDSNGVVYASRKAKNYALGAPRSLANPGTKWRGGATVDAPRSRPRRGKNQSADSNVPKSLQSLQQKLPSVQAILVHRRVNLLQVIQFVSFICLLLSLLACVTTAGTPRP